LTDQLRKTIDESGLSLYAIAKATSTPYAVIYGFANRNRDIKLGTTEKPADLFGIEFTESKHPKTQTIGRKAGKKKGG
jgi:hypothetical protein